MTVNHTLLAQEIIAQLQKDEHATLWISREDHALQHTFVKKLMEDAARKEARRQAIFERLIGTATVSAILTGLGLVGKWVINWLAAHFTFTH